MCGSGGSAGKAPGYGLDGLVSIPDSSKAQILNLRSAYHHVQTSPEIHSASSEMRQNWGKIGQYVAQIHHYHHPTTYSPRTVIA